MRRVVVTGLGMVTPLGVGVDHNWSRILAGQTGISHITNFKVDDISCQIAGQVPGADVEGGLDLDSFIDPREQRRQDRFIQLGVVAAQLAVEDSGWMPEDRESQNRTGVMIGSGIG
ncbi:MAG: beta-ketoacyl synthase N-terminal-like domain-containing protein, partial [Pseudomonadota bacterium]|nr:beta-ketoacyl synthase N-terminal-like domain-containing protein [Pseudomonadota bacterium]